LVSAEERKQTAQVWLFRHNLNSWTNDPICRLGPHSAKPRKSEQRHE